MCFADRDSCVREMYGDDGSLPSSHRRAYWAVDSDEEDEEEGGEFGEREGDNGGVIGRSWSWLEAMAHRSLGYSVAVVVGKI